MTSMIQSIPIKLIIILLSSTLPDIDISLGIKHRGLTHSLLCFIPLSLAIFIIYPLGFIPFVIGYGSHLIADSLNISGIQIFYPKKGRYGLKILEYRSEFENYIYGACSFIIFIYIFYQVYIIMKPLIYM